jgi:hypothetical protein
MRGFKFLASFSRTLASDLSLLILFKEVPMGKPVISREAFRGLLAFYAAKAHHDHKPRSEHCLLRLFGSEEDVPDTLVLQWQGRTELLGSKPIGRLMDPILGQLTHGNAQYDHASDFLHTLLGDLGQKCREIHRVIACPGFVHACDC